jgi:hypothetical protein
MSNDINKINNMLRVEYQLNSYGRAFPTYIVDLERNLKDELDVEILLKVYRAGKSFNEATLYVTAYAPHFNNGNDQHLPVITKENTETTRSIGVQ